MKMNHKKVIRNTKFLNQDLKLIKEKIIATKVKEAEKVLETRTNKKKTTFQMMMAIIIIMILIKKVHSKIIMLINK